VEGVPFRVDFVAIELGYALVQQLQARHAVQQAALQPPVHEQSVCGYALMQQLQARHAVHQAALQPAVHDQCGESLTPALLDLSAAANVHCI